MKRCSRLVGALIAGLVLWGTPAHANSITGDLFFTTFSGDDRVFSTVYNYDGATTITYTTPTVISSLSDGLGGADGIAFDATDPDNYLIIGGQNGFFYRVNIASGTVTPSFNFSGNGATIFHLETDPSGTAVWGTGIPDSPAVKLDLTPFDTTGGSSLVLPIVNNVGSGDTSITDLGFVPDGLGGFTVYYTRSGPGGVGNFGTIDLGTGETTRLFTNISSTHGLIYDPFLGDLILVGDDEIHQFDPSTNLFVSLLSVDLATGSPDPTQAHFDQGSVDGQGHLFVAVNDGRIFFMDYNATSDVANAGNFTDLQFLQAHLDDLAPIIERTPPPPTVPEPASMMLFGIGGLGALVSTRRKRIRA